jgi:hypothetical protein
VIPSLPELATLPLLEFGPDGNPIGHASACVVRRGHRRSLLTAEHAARNPLHRFAVVTRWNRELRHAELRYCDHIHFLGVFSWKPGKTKQPESIDLGFERLPKPLSAKWRRYSDQNELVDEQSSVELESLPDFKPDPGESYSFCGLTRYEDLPSGKLQATLQIESNMQLVGAGDHWLEFVLARPFQPLNHFPGCSGAPIVDSKGRLAGLVQEVGKRQTKIIGINVSAYNSIWQL